MAQLCDEYLPAGKGRIKPSTLENDRSRIKAHIVPLLGNKPVEALRPADAEKFLRDIIDGKTAKTLAVNKATGRPMKGSPIHGGTEAASRSLGLLGTILQRAVRDGLLDRNPAHAIERPKFTSARPQFSFDAVGRAGIARREREGLEMQNALRAVRLLILTGCGARLREYGSGPRACI